MIVNATKQAFHELNDAADWYEAQQAGLAQLFIDAYENCLLQLQKNPRIFSRVENYRGRREIRRCMFEKFPYLMIFEILANEVLILAVIHTSRHPKEWRERLQ